MDLVVEPDGNAANALLGLSSHRLESTLEVLLGRLAELSLTKKISVRAHKVVRTSNDSQRLASEALEARVEGSVASARVKDPAVLLSRRLALSDVGKRDVVGVGRSGARRRAGRVERGAKRLGRVGEGGDGGLVSAEARLGGRVKGAGAEERVSRLDLEGGSRAREQRLLGLVINEVVVERSGVRLGRVEGANVCMRGNQLQAFELLCTLYSQGSEWTTTLRKRGVRCDVSFARARSENVF